MIGRRLTWWLAGPLAVAAAACPVAAGARPVGPDAPVAAVARPVGPGTPTLTVPEQPIGSEPVSSHAATPAPLLRVIELSDRVTAGQFEQVVQEIESGTPARPTVVIAPPFVAVTSPPDPGLIARLGRSAGPDHATVVLTPTPARTGPRSGAMLNAVALLYARIPQRLLTAAVALQPGAIAADWSVLRSYDPGCSSLCGPLSAGQAVPYAQLVADGGRPVRSAEELLAVLRPSPQAGMSWERVVPASAAAFAPLFPSHNASPSPPAPPGHAHPGGLSLALVAGLIAAVLLVAGLLVRWRVRRPSRSLRPALPPQPLPAGSAGRRGASVERSSRTDQDAFPTVLGAGEALAVPVRSGFSPEGYVEIDDCLMRATWCDASPPPQPGTTVTARVVAGALQASGAGAGTRQAER